MKKRLVSWLLTVIMVVSLVPFSAISVLAADGEAGTADDLVLALASAGDGDTVKLTANVTDNTKAYVLNKGVTLDLNGHEFAYQSIDATAIHSRIIDTKPGEYKIYESLTTTGKQWIPLGLNVGEIVTVDAKTTNKRSAGSSGPTAFMGGWKKNASGTQYHWFVLGFLFNANTNYLGTRFNYTPNTGADQGKVQKNNNIVSSTALKAAITWGANAKPFEFHWVVKSGKQSMIVDGGTNTFNLISGADDAGTTLEGTFPAKGISDWNVNLLTTSGEPANMGGWKVLTTTTLNTEETDTEKTAGYGRLGWRGDTYYCNINANADAGTPDKSTVRTYVPAKSTTGALGFFDTTNGEFYPLIGVMHDEVAVNNEVASAIIRNDGSFTIKKQIKTAAELDEALKAAKSGDTVTINANITAAYDIALTDGVKLDLNGFSLTANSFSAQEDSLLDSSAAATGSLVTDGTFSCTGKDYTYKKSGNVYTVVEGVPLRLKHENAICTLDADYVDQDGDYTLAKGAVLDLNGHKFDVKSLDARKGKVKDSSLDIQNSTEKKANLSRGSVVVDGAFLYAETNPLIVIDNEDGSYNFRKYEITYLPGSATGWTLAEKFDSATSKYIQYVSYGDEITLSDMIYTADGAHVSWKLNENLFEPGSKYSAPVSGNLTFSTEAKLITVNGASYLSWADAAKQIVANAAVTIYGKVKLTSDMLDTTVTYTLDSGAELDLNGHKFAYKNIVASGVNARVIDSAVGEYEFHESITTTGKQFVMTGLAFSSVTGLKARTSSLREKGNGSWVCFVGTAAKNTITTTQTDYEFLLALTSGSGLYTRFNYANNGAYTNKAATYAWGSDNLAVGKMFDWEAILNTGVQKVTINGTAKLNQTGNAFTLPLDGFDDKTLLLFNKSDANWNQLNETESNEMFAGKGANTDATFGKRGWYGATEYAQLFSDPANTATNTNMVRDFVPAKSLSSGMIGMFDKVENVFYPLLGTKLDCASLNGDPTEIVVRRANGTRFTVSAFDASEFASVLSGIQSGETIQMMDDITFPGNVTVPSNVSLSLNGHRLTATNVSADSTQSAFIVDRTFSGGVTVSGTFNIGAGHEDYQFVTTDNHIYTIKANWVSRMRKAQSGETVKLTDDLNDNFDYVLADGATLDLNGHTMKVGSLDASLGYVIDSTILAEDNTGAGKNLAASKIITDDFSYSDNNTFKVVDNGSNTYTVRKYTLRFLPGEASGWTMTEKLGAFSEDSVYEMYCTYGETKLPEMIYTASSTGVWSFSGENMAPDTACSVNDDMKFTAKFVALSLTSGGKTTYYPSASAGNLANVMKATSGTVTFLSDSKLTCNADLSKLDVVLNEGVTLDLNGYTLKYKSINTMALHTRVVDTAPTTYTKYESLTTVGKQFIATGLNVREITDVDGKVTSSRQYGSTGPTFFMGGWKYAADGTSVMRWGPLGLMGATGPIGQMRAYYSYSGSIGIAKSITINGTNFKVGDNAEPFTFEFTVKSGKQYIRLGDTVSLNETDTSTYPHPNLIDWNVNILNSSGELTKMDGYSTITGSVISTDISNGYDTQAALDKGYGRLGWRGNTYYCNINPDGADKTKTRTFVAAKSDKTGAIGLFDTTNGMFYPLLGVDNADVKVNNASGIIKLAADGSLLMADRYEVLNATPLSNQLAVRKSNGSGSGECGWFDLNTHIFSADSGATGSACGLLAVDGEGKCTFIASDANFFTAALSFAKDGDTVAIDTAITTDAAVTVRENVTLDLFGHDLTVKSLDADQTGAALIDSSETNAAVFASGTLTYNKDTSKYAYQDVEGGVYLCRLLAPCTNESEFEAQVTNAIARDVIRLGDNIYCKRTSFGYAIPAGAAIQPLGDYRIHYYASLPQSLADLLNNSNQYCTIHLTGDFTEGSDFFAVPKDVIVLKEGHEFKSKTSPVKKIDDGFVGTGTENQSDLSMVSRLLSASGTIRLEKDINDTRDYVLGEGAILDLNGHNISCNSFDGTAGHVIDTAKRGGHTITVRDAENTAFRTADPMGKVPNLHHYIVNEDDTVYTFYPYTITYYPGEATAWNAATIATEGAFEPGVPYIQEVTRGQVTLMGSIFSNTKVDFGFVNWNTAANFNGEQISGGSIRTISQDVILYAQFTKCHFTYNGAKKCFNDLKQALAAADAYGYTGTISIVGNMTVNGDLKLGSCDLELTGAVVLAINGNLDLNGRFVNCKGTSSYASSTLKVSGAITDSTYGTGYVTRVATGLVQNGTPDPNFIEVVYPKSANTEYRYFNANEVLYFNQANTKLISGTGEHAGQKAMVFELGGYFNSKLATFLADEDTHIYVNMTLTNSKFFTFRADDNSALFFARKTGDTWTLTGKWDITQMLRDANVPGSVDNIYTVLTNGADTLLSIDAQILVTNGDATIHGSTVTTNVG